MFTGTLSPRRERFRRGFFHPLLTEGTFVMKPPRNHALTLLIFLVAFSGCEKTIDVNLDPQPTKLVVDGSIENGHLPIVILSKSLDYFSEITPAILSNSFVHGAKVTVADGFRSNVLVEYSVHYNDTTTLYYYSTDTTSPGAAIFGAVNTRYYLTIEWDNKEYKANTLIPYVTKQIDSLWYKPAPDNPDTNLVQLWIRATDPKGYGDYVRYYTKRNNEPFYPGFNSVFDDQIIDGTTYELPVDRGTSRNNQREDDDSFFEKGDTVTLKLCNIDKATFEFWNSFEFSYQSVGNPFSSPTKVASNISNGALGYFGGYAAQFRSIIIPK